MEFARQAMGKAVHFENTPDGIAKYHAARTEWNNTHPDIVKVDFACKSLLLRPGTAGLGERECWRCGMVNHMSKDCRVPPAEALDILEQEWCALIARSLNPRMRQEFAGLAQINTEDGPMFYDPSVYVVYDTANLYFEDQSAGNGQEEHK